MIPHRALTRLVGTKTAGRVVLAWREGGAVWLQFADHIEQWVEEPEAMREAFAVLAKCQTRQQEEAVKMAA